MLPSSPPAPDSPPPPIASLVVDGQEYPWCSEIRCPEPEVDPPPWSRGSIPKPFEVHEAQVRGLTFTAWSYLDHESWTLRATLPSGAQGDIPPPGLAEDVRVFSRPCFVTRADVWWMATWVATRFTQASPPPRSVHALLGLESIHISDPRLSRLRHAYRQSLWFARAVREFYAGAEHPDVDDASAACEQACAASAAAQYALERNAVLAWRRARYEDQRRDERIVDTDRNGPAAGHWR